MLTTQQLFNEQFYLTIYPEAAKDIGVDKIYKSAFDHFIGENGKVLDKNGEKIWYDPSPFFDTYYYLTAYPEVRQALRDNASLTPLQHFINEGLKKGFNPSPFFDTDYYLKELKELGVINIIGHLMETAFEYFFHNNGVTLNQNGASLYYNSHRDGDFAKHVLSWRQRIRDKCQCFPYLFIAEAALGNNKPLELTTFDFSNLTQAMPQDVERYLAYQRLAKIDKSADFNFSTSKSDWLVLHDNKVIDDVIKKITKLDQLFNAGFDSATIIATCTKETFIARMQSMVEMDRAALEKYYDAAKGVAAELSLHYLHSYQTLSPCVRSGWAFQGHTTFNNDTSYPELFGKLDYLNVDENNSVFSPAAYFFELMRIATNPEHVTIGRNLFRSLKTRRPDLFEIPIDSAHSYQKVPYLQLVNYALGKQYLKNFRTVSENYELQAEDNYENKFADCERLVFENVARGKELFYPPFVLPLQEIHAGLAAANTSLHEIYSALQVQPQPTNTPNFADYSIAREYLQITQPEALWLVQMHQLQASFRLTDEMAIGEFYTATGLKKEQLKDLISYDAEMKSSEKRAAYQRLYINAGSLAPITITVDYAQRSEKIKNLTTSRLQRLSTFTFLTGKLGVSNSELQTVFDALNVDDHLTEENIKAIANLQWLHQQSQLPISDISYFMLTTTGFEHIYNNIINHPEFFKQKNKEAKIYASQGNELIISLSNLLNNTLNTSQRQAIQRLCVSLNITPAELAQLVNTVMLKSSDDPSEKRFPEQPLTNLIIVSYLYRAINLAKLLNVTIAELVMLHHLAVVKKPTADRTELLVSLANYLIPKTDQDSYRVINNITGLFSTCLMLQQAQISITALCFIICSSSSEIYKKQLEEKNTRFLEELQKQITSYIISQSPLLNMEKPAPAEIPASNVPPKNIELPLSALEKLICEKLANYFSVEFDLVAAILKSLASSISAPAENTVLEVNPIVTYLAVDKNEVALVDKIQFDASKLIALFQVVTLAKMLNLKFSKNSQNVYDDVSLLCLLLKSSKEADKPTIGLDDVIFLFNLKQLQKIFKNESNDFLKYFNIQDKAAFLALTQWDANTFDKLSNSKYFSIQLSANAASTYPDISKLTSELLALSRVFAIIGKLDQHADILFVLAAIDDQSEELSYQRYDQIAQSLRQLNNAHLDGASKNSVVETFNQLEEQKRTVLTRRLLHPTAQDLSTAQISSSKLNKLCNNQYLRAGDYLVAENRKAFAILERDGNFVIYSGSGPANQGELLWQTKTGAKNRADNWQGSYIAVMQSDANFIIYKGASPTDAQKSVWASWNTSPSPRYRLDSNNAANCFLMLENSGNLCLYKGMPEDERPEKCWETATRLPEQGAFVDKSDSLTVNQYLKVGDYLFAKDGKSLAVLECDGNLVVYKINEQREKQGIYWETHTGNPQWQDGYHAILQSDGNFVIYKGSNPDKRQEAVWSSWTTAAPYKLDDLRDKPCFIRLEEQGSLCLYKGNPTDPQPEGRWLAPRVDAVTIADNWQKIKTVDDLSQYLLLDVQMSGCDLTSPIAQGIASIQLYLQRCRLGIETGVQLNIPEPWWPWLENYRLWEANRKVLLHPENYIEPDLRIKQSPEFKKLTQDLLQSHLDNEAVDRVFRQYFHQLTDLSRLIYTAACAAPKKEDPKTQIIYLFAHTRHQPYEYYLRTVEYTEENMDHLTWGYWQKIEVPISTGVITPIYAFDRLFLFFVESTFNAQKDMSVSGNTVADNKANINFLNFKIKCTYQNSHGIWQTLQILREKNQQPLDSLITSYFKPFAKEKPAIKAEIKNGVLQLVEYNDNNFTQPLETNQQLQFFNYLLNHVEVNLQIDNNQNKLIQLGYFNEKLLIDEHLTVTVNVNTEAAPGYPYSTHQNYAFDLYKPKEQMSLFFYNDLTAEQFKANFLLTCQKDLTEILNEIDYKKICMAAIFQLKSEILREDLSADKIDIDKLKSFIQKVKMLVKEISDSLHSNNDLSRINNDIENFEKHDIEEFDRHPHPNLKPTAKKIEKILQDILQVIENHIPELFQNQLLANTSPRADLILIKALASVVLLNNIDEAYFVSASHKRQFQFKRLSSTSAVYQLNRSLLLGGFDDIYRRMDENLEHDFSRLIFADNVANRFIGPTSTQLDFNGGFSNYYWEVFFHAPFYIANQLNAQQRFAEARDWYHYIFNPNKGVVSTVTANKFKFPPFQTIDLNCNLLTDQMIMQVYREHMFDPHAIAELRPIAYMKAVVMKYINNLIDWGDYEFALNTRESITQATNFYLMAKELLGDKPQALGSPERTTKVISFQDYISEKIVLSEITEKIFKVFENNLKNHGTVANNTTLNDFSSYFSLPENKEFIAYWDKIDDRLFKIRHCQNIQGIKQILDLFSPELDVMQLVRLAATSGGEDVKEMLDLPLSPYRFEVMLGRAKEMTTQLIQLGNELLTALEKQDYENLNLIVARQQMNTLNLINQIKQKQIEEAKAALEQTQLTINSVQNRLDYYANLIKDGLSNEERAAIGLKVGAQAFYTSANIANVISQGLLVIPQAEIGFAAIGPYDTVSYGGMELGYAMQAVASGLEGGGNLLNFAAEDVLTMANYKRREQDWKQQKQQAEGDLVTVNKQLAINKIQLDIAKQEYDNQQQLIQQQQELNQYYQSKFTNVDLYRWYVDQLAMLYRQAYEVALSTAKAAEKAYQFEQYPVQKSKVLISNTHYSFFRKGLLAGQALMNEVTNMEKTYLDNNKRLFEIEKTISLKTLNDNSQKNILDAFKGNKSVSFTLGEELFNDFANHCNRRIKRISITIPALAKPYQNINLVLTQNESWIEKTIKDPSDCPKRGEQIILSKGINDTGTFEASLQDARYLPFEGTGVISKWTLELGNTKASNSDEVVKSISDIIMRIEYTAQFKSNNVFINNLPVNRL